MATSPRLSLVSPLRVWVVFNALFIAIVWSSWYTSYRLAAGENQKLATMQAQTLTKSRFEDLKGRRFRDFVEGIGGEFGNLYVQVSMGAESFQFGRMPSPRHCGNVAYQLAGSGPEGNVQVTICRPFVFAVWPILAVLLVYLLISGFSLVFVRRLERRTTAALVEFLRGSGVEIDPGRDLIGIMADMRDIRLRLDQAQAQERQLIDTRARAELAEQVAHDIRSPLTALEASVGDAAALPENKRLQIRSALARIRDIANGLLDQRRASMSADGSAVGTSELSPHLLSSLIEPIISEKRLAAGSESCVMSDAVPYGLFARVQAVEFKRVLSNLINNALEARGENSDPVRVRVSEREGEVLVAVSDSGKGIPAELLAKLGKRGASYGKAGGSGLGLHHARVHAEAWGGRLDIASAIGMGTTVTLALPAAPAPDWFAPELALSQGGVLVILDDEEGIHQVWRSRLEAVGKDGHGVEVRDFYTPKDMRDWVKGNPAEASRAFYLLDHDLGGFPETGLSLAAELGLERRTILVTGRHDDAEVLRKCRERGIRMLPKDLALQVPIRVGASAPPSGSQPQLLDAVLIDDDPLTRLTWKNAASDLGKSFRAFPSSAAFLRESDEIDRRTPVYLDAKLGDGISGADESLRIHKLGFVELYLATGHPPEMFSGCKHLRAVVGKEPPWPAR